MSAYRQGRGREHTTLYLPTEDPYRNEPQKVDSAASQSQCRKYRVGLRCGSRMMGIKPIKIPASIAAMSSHISSTKNRQPAAHVVASVSKPIAREITRPTNHLHIARFLVLAQSVTYRLAHNSCQCQEQQTRPSPRSSTYVTHFCLSIVLAWIYSRIHNAGRTIRMLNFTYGAVDAGSGRLSFANMRPATCSN